VTEPNRTTSVSSRTLWLVIGVVLIFGFILLTWLFGPGWQASSDDFAELPEDGAEMIGLAAILPEGRTLQTPIGADSDGERVYVALSDEGMLMPVGVDGSLEESIALPVVSPAPMISYPTDVAAAGGRIAYVDSAGEGAVVTIRDSGADPLQIGREGDGELVQPTAVAATDGDVFVADAGTSEIKVFSWDGMLKRSIGTLVEPPLTFVGGMTFAGDRLWVADSNSGRVLALDPVSGRVELTLSGSMTLPRGLTTDDAGNLYVADEFARVVKIYDPDGLPLGEIGSPDMLGYEEGGRLEAPRDVVWQGGRAWVVDGPAGTIKVYNVRLE
jgi:DNA-binding beta-propeller fold protein YncE